MVSNKEMIGKFATINQDGLEEHDLNKGDTVIIAGSGFTPIDDQDNYKLLFVVCKTEGGKLQDKGTAIKRESMDLLSDERCSELRQEIEAQHGKQEVKAEA